MNSYDEGNLFVKPTSNNKEMLELSFGSFNTPMSEKEVKEPNINLVNSEGIILSINGFSKSFSIESYNQKGVI